ncbi:MAG: hypothetical protein AB7E47_08105 [Desulfovibrionaceae bacterium]
MRIVLGLFLFLALLGGALFFTPSDLILNILDPSLSPDALERQVLEAKSKVRASLLKRAQNGDAEAQYRVGCQYALGEHSAKDAKEAFAWYAKAAAQGHALAQYALGRLYWNGEGVAQNMALAALWMRRSADQGDPYGQFGLGVLCATGQGVKRDAMAAIDLFEKAAGAGLADALRALEDFAAHGSQATQSGVLAASPAALEADDTPAAATAPSVNNSRREAIAVKMLRLLAMRGEARAQCSLGMFLLQRDDPASWTEAVQWLKQSAQQKFTQAYFMLGLAHLLGKGVAKDHAEAMQWARLGADAGHADSQFVLGLSLGSANMPGYDPAEAARYLHAAATQGHRQAQLFYGGCLEKDKGVPKDMDQAVAWYKKSAEQGFALAQLKLGALYMTGTGVPKNPALGRQWIQKAEDQGKGVDVLFASIFQNNATARKELLMP